MAERIKASALTPTFGAIPVRAAQDSNITSSMFRTLVAVAAHDRLNKNGAGCYAPQRRLAKMIGMDHTQLCKALSELVRLGYLSAQPNSLNRKLMVYRVLYTAEDGTVFVGSTANRVVGSFNNTKLVLGDANVGAAANIVLAENVFDVATPNGQALESAARSNAKDIFEEKDNRTLRDCGPPRGGVVDGPARRPASEILRDGAIIDKLERQASDGAVLDAEATAELRRMVGTSGPDSPLRRRAEALLQQRGAA